MLSLVTMVERYALGDSMSASCLAVWKRRNASWTMSSASLTLPSIR